LGKHLYVYMPEKIILQNWKTFWETKLTDSCIEYRISGLLNTKFYPPPILTIYCPKIYLNVILAYHFRSSKWSVTEVNFAQILSALFLMFQNQSYLRLLWNVVIFLYVFVLLQFFSHTHCLRNQ
jgi:hypothetical protein